jgi:signal transduction histidine kinase
MVSQGLWVFGLFTLLLNYFLLAMFLFIAYVFVVYIKAAKNNRVGSGYALWSTMAGLIINVLIYLEYFGVVSPQKILIFVGYIAFFFLQSLILSFRFTFQLNKSRMDAEQGLLAKSEFLATMSHEIRTLLNSVIGLSNLLLRDNPRKDQEEYLKVMVFSANNLLSIYKESKIFRKRARKRF